MAYITITGNKITQKNNSTINKIINKHIYMNKKIINNRGKNGNNQVEEQPSFEPNDIINCMSKDEISVIASVKDLLHTSDG